MVYRSIHPATGEDLEAFSNPSEVEIEQALARAKAAFTDWRRRTVQERIPFLVRVAEILDQKAPDLAKTMASEMGKIRKEGEAEVRKCAWVCRFYAENAAAFLNSRAADSDGSEARISFEPLGPILAIMPWNFPFWQVFRFAAPALAAGNVGLLKHAPSTPRCALEIVEIMNSAGLPEGVFQNLFLSDEQASRVITHPIIRGVTLTGSTRAGREVAAQAGRALKPMVMELGGSDPFIVFGDADLDRALDQGVLSRCLNNGQSCIAAKRFVVESSILEVFLEGFVERMSALTLGDPLVEGVEIGPLARADLRECLADQVERARAAGAQVLCGGKTSEGPGFFYPPTVITGLDPQSTIADEEFFGPVAIVFPFKDESEALAIANATSYGLGSSLWTSDHERYERLIPEIESGAVFVNGLVKSDPRLPFGGIKASGFGRELAREGLLEFVNTKTVWIA